MSRGSQIPEAALGNQHRATSGARARRIIAVSASGTFQDFINSISRYRRSSDSETDRIADSESESDEPCCAGDGAAAPNGPLDRASPPPGAGTPTKTAAASPQKPKHSLLFNIASRVIPDLLLAVAVPVVYELYTEYCAREP
ncbi:putative membrane protein US8A [Equid herpesvirus 6]|uniref:Membrane protein US8A n=1 Tax=Equid herpesvirus 6 TaxID=173566 RepID=A0A7S9VMC2_9ALPH|nr:putative membrane protein US8A [Equid herpesvirus 6]QPI70186.1 putative membrane protein US8A [Equid herpesvirus 6]